MTTTFPLFVQWHSSLDRRDIVLNGKGISHRTQIVYSHLNVFCLIFFKEKSSSSSKYKTSSSPGT